MMDLVLSLLYRVVLKPWKKKNNMKCMEWQAQSLDLKPIENLWVTLKRAISARQPSPKNISVEESCSKVETNSSYACPKISYVDVYACQNGNQSKSAKAKVPLSTWKNSTYFQSMGFVLCNLSICQLNF